MKINRIMISSLAVAFVVAIVAAVLYAPIINRILFAMQLEEPEKIAGNLRQFNDYYPSHLIPKSDTPSALLVQLRDSVLPDSFTSHGEQVSTRDFLKEGNTTGLMVLKDGAVIFENYWQGLDKSTPQYLFSVSKSMTSILIGFAIADRLIDDVNDPIVKYRPEFKGSAWDKATIANALEMSSGVDFLEDYSQSDTDMDEFRKRFAFDKPILPFILSLNSAYEPGQRQGYNSMETQVAGLVLRSVIGNRTLADYMHEKVWQPLGAQDSARWTTDASGMELAIGGMSATLRDIAKVGQLFLQRGDWNGRQILPEAWVLESTTPSKPYQLPGRDNPWSSKPFGCGYLWWIPVDPNGREYYASGLYGQYLFINEDKGVVIAMFNANYQFNQRPDWWKERYEDLFQAIAQGQD